jgi:hypothetical protein
VQLVVLEGPQVQLVLVVQTVQRLVEVQQVQVAIL